MALYRSLGPLSRFIADIPWPMDFFTPENLSVFLDEIFVQDYEINTQNGSFSAALWLAIKGELSLSLPGLDGIKFVVGSGNISEYTFITASLIIGVDSLLTLNNVTLALRFDPSILKPAALNPGDPLGQFAEIQMTGSIRVNSSFDVTIEGFDTIKLTPAMIGDTGIIIAADDVKLDLSRTSTLPEVIAAGFDESFIGIFIGDATVKLPEDWPALAPENLVLHNSAIGSGGVSGQLKASYTPQYDDTTKTFTGRGGGHLFGIPFGIQDIDINLKQNSFRSSKITGQLLMPFFDKRLAVEMALDLSGNLAVKVIGALDEGDSIDADTGILTLIKHDILKLKVDSLGFEVENGIFTAKLSGQVTPLFGESEDLKWPSFDVKELAIDSKGNIHIEGGWIDLPSKYSLDFHGFPLEITKLGFGKTGDGGGKWVGFSGGLKFVEGMSPGASVEGLRIIWYDDAREPRITLDGASVELDISGVLHFKGAVSYRKLKENDIDVHRFDGAIQLELKALNTKVEGILVIGSETGPEGNYTFLAIYLTYEFPSGIALWATGLALYGVSGLFALNMEPNKKANEGWYEDPASGKDGWYKREPVGVTDFKSKWDPKLGSLALGVGAIIGTYPDNGNAFSGKFLLAIVFPGPIVLLEGKGDLLKKRPEMDKSGQKSREEPRFRALAVLDERAGTFEIGMDARYKKDDTGKLLDIRGGADAFFNFHDENDWHIYIGQKEPREKRIRADLFKIYQANAYLMLDAHCLAMGAWVGYSKSLKAGPLKVSLEAWIEANAVLNWTPEHLTGDLWLHGKAELKVFGFGASVTLDAQFRADVYDPFHVVGKLAFSAKPPWPVPRIRKTIPFEWGPTLSPPPLPLPLKEVTIEDLKAATKWPLPRTIQNLKDPQKSLPGLLRPNYDDGNGFRREPDATPDTIDTSPPPQGLPTVPLDCKPCITFSRPVNDGALTGVSPPDAGSKWEQIGDPAKNQGPAKVRYSLREISLSKWDGAKWKQIASTSSQDDRTKLYSSWAPLPDNPDGGGQDTAQTKLMLWSKTPFDHTRSSGDAWDEWFINRFGLYPRQPDLPDREICCNFEGISPTEVFELPWQCPKNPGMILVWPFMAQAVGVLDPPMQDLAHALCFPRLISTTGVTYVTCRWLLIQLKNPAKRVRITILAGQAPEQSWDFKTLKPGPAPNPWIVDGIRIFAYESFNELPSQINVVSVELPEEKISGFQCDQRMEIALPCASPFVSLQMTVKSGIAEISAFNADDSPVRKKVSVKGTKTPQVQNAIIEGPAINRLSISGRSQAVVHGISFDCSSLPIVTATGFDKTGRAYGPVSPQNNVLDVQGNDITRVLLRATGQYCVLEICATYGPSPEETDLRKKVNDHTKKELERWSQRGNILEPHTAYRLKIDTNLDVKDFPHDPRFNRTLAQTEYAYFRTDGPPGLGHLSVPVASPDARDIALQNKIGEFVTIGEKGKPGSIDPTMFDPGLTLALKSTLDSLENYVRQTIPPTIANVGGAGTEGRVTGLAYRAYDLGVAFNENYLNLMYRLRHRNLGLYIYDKNNLPATDTRGQRISFTIRWIDADRLVLDRSEERWISAVESSGLANFDQAVIPKDDILMAISEGRILEPGTAYDVRLVPLLLYDDFSTYPAGSAIKGPLGALDDWAVKDIGTIGGPSSWEVKDDVTLRRWIIQTSGIKAATPGDSGQLKPGTVLIYRDDLSLADDDPRQPSQWADYRLRVRMQSNSDGLIGVVFRFIDQGNFYIFSMDRLGKRRRLARVVAGVYLSLAEDSFTYNKAQPYLISIEAVGPSIRVHQDGSKVFDVTDSSLGRGCIGLCCSNNSSAGFSDVNVDDLGAIADAVYGFSFTTSRFANFFHHMHSFQDVAGVGSLKPNAGGPLASDKAVSPVNAPTDEEFRAYEDLASRLPEEIVLLNPPEVQVTVIDQEKMVFLLQSPEPMDWSRMDLEVYNTGLLSQDAHVPLDLKLTDVSFGTTSPNEESVTVLLREEADLSGYRIEFQSSPSGSEPEWTTYYVFGAEAAMPPGTRVTVYAGNSSAPGLPSPKPGLVQRFVALGNDQGLIRLTSGVAYLRLIGPDGMEGKIVHARRFVADSMYNNTRSGIVRKADGTSLFIFLPDVAESEAKLYRLKMIYYKNNTAKRLDSQVLSQCGDKDPESVKIDIPWSGFR